MLRLLLLAGALLGPATAQRVECDPTDVDIYQFNSTSIYGNETITFDRYAGKVVLIYNVATYCGLTVPSYTQINALADMYAGQDLVMLGFPSNLFNKQEPFDTPDELFNGIRWARPGGNFTTQMTQFFEKSDVNGANENPFYTYLKGTCNMTFTEFDTGLYYSPLRVGDIYWNFEKFLIGRDGKPYTRYNPVMTAVDDVSPDIDFLLAQPIP